MDDTERSAPIASHLLRVSSALDMLDEKLRSETARHAELVDELPPLIDRLDAQLRHFRELHAESLVADERLARDLAEFEAQKNTILVSSS